MEIDDKALFKCGQCGAVTEFCDESVNAAYEEGECFFFNCPGGDCKAKWCYCKTCKKRFNSNNHISHAGTKSHKKAHAAKYKKEDSASTVPTTTNNDAMEFDAFVADDEASLAAMAPAELCAHMDEELNATYIQNAPNMDKVEGPMLQDNPSSMFPNQHEG